LIFFTLPDINFFLFLSQKMPVSSIFSRLILAAIRPASVEALSMERHRIAMLKNASSQFVIVLCTLAIIGISFFLFTVNLNHSKILVQEHGTQLHGHSALSGQ
jgi:hypothetical protein